MAKAGRPRKEIDLQELERLAEICDTDVAICQGLRISPTVFYENKKSNSAIQEAIDRGRAKTTTKAVSKLVELIDEKNLGAICFWLKCKAGWRDTQKIETENVSEVTLKWQE